MIIQTNILPHRRSNINSLKEFLQQETIGFFWNQTRQFFGKNISDQQRFSLKADLYKTNYQVRQMQEGLGHNQ